MCITVCVVYCMNIVYGMNVVTYMGIVYVIDCINVTLIYRDSGL